MSFAGPPLVSWSTTSCGNLPVVRSMRLFSVPVPVVVGAPPVLADVPASVRMGPFVGWEPPVFVFSPGELDLEASGEQPKGNTPAIKMHGPSSVAPGVLVRRLVIIESQLHFRAVESRRQLQSEHWLIRYGADESVDRVGASAPSAIHQRGPD